MEVFERPHHRRIAFALRALHGTLLRDNKCLFAGGTAIALRFGEYRESVYMDFLVSDVACYRNLRQLVTTANGIAAILREGTAPLIQSTAVRADQYGIRTTLDVADQAIKFEIVLEARIELAAPGIKDSVCGIATLTPLDMATTKLLANSDRWADQSVFNRDVIDLAMMKPSLRLLRQAIAKAETAYGDAIRKDLDQAIQHLQGRNGRLERCLEALAIKLPKVVVWKHLRALRRVLG